MHRLPAALASALATVALYAAPAMAASAADTFSDVPAGHWAERAVTFVAVERGFMHGFPDGTFKGDQPFTRVQLAQAVDELIRQLETQTKVSWKAEGLGGYEFQDLPADPEARAKVWAVRPAWKAATENLTPFSGAALDGDTLVARTGYTGEDGFEIVLPAAQATAFWNDLAAAGVRPCGLGARDTLRLEAGMNLYGQDMDELIHPDQAGLTWTVSLKDAARRFIGRDAIEQFATPAAFLGLKLLDRGVMRSHMKVQTALGEGEVTSGTMSPTLNVSVGFARLPVGVMPGDAVQVDIRGKWVPAQVCKMPFVRNGKAVEHA